MGTVRQTGEPFQIQRWEAPSISLEGLADLLDKVLPLSSPVVDTTGLKDGQPCERGCAIKVPAISQRILYYQVVYDNGVTGPIEVVAVP